MNFKIKFYTISILMISILNIPLFSSAGEPEFCKAMKQNIKITTTLKSKGEGEAKEINKIIDSMLEALYHSDPIKFEPAHTQFLKHLKARQLRAFNANCIATLLQFQKCTPEILKVILNSDSGTDLIQQTFPIDKSLIIGYIMDCQKFDLFEIIIKHSKTYQLFISPKETPDLKDSKTPEPYDQIVPFQGHARDIFKMIMSDRLKTLQKPQYLQTTLWFKEIITSHLEALGLKKNGIDLTNFNHLCASYENKKTEIEAIMTAAANETPI